MRRFPLTCPPVFVAQWCRVVQYLLLPVLTGSIPARFDVSSWLLSSPIRGAKGKLSRAMHR
jgi:hypothetical protein